MCLVDCCTLIVVKRDSQISDVLEYCTLCSDGACFLDLQAAKETKFKRFVFVCKEISGDGSVRWMNNDGKDYSVPLLRGNDGKAAMLEAVHSKVLSRDGGYLLEKL